MTPKYRVGSMVEYTGPTFPHMRKRALVVRSSEANDKAGFIYSIGLDMSGKGVRAWEKNLRPWGAAAQSPQLVRAPRKFAVGARVLSDGIEGIVKDILGDLYVVALQGGRQVQTRESNLTAVILRDTSGLTPAQIADDIATRNFITAQEQQQAAPPGLWQDSKRVRAAAPGLLVRKTTLHTKPIKLIVAALPSALRYVP